MKSYKSDVKQVQYHTVLLRIRASNCSERIVNLSKAEEKVEMAFPARLEPWSTSNRKILGLTQAIAIFWITGNLASAVPMMPSLDNDVRVAEKSVADHSLHNLAAEITSMMNLSVKPCDDFREFVCGNTPADFRLAIPKITTRELREVFADPSPPGELKPLTYAKNLYKSCINSDSEPDWSRLREILRLFGGWPAVEGDSWSGENKSWRQLQTDLSKAAFEGFFEVLYVDREFILLDSISHFVNYQTLNGSLHNSQVTEYRNKLVDIAVKMGANPDSARREIDSALEFDRQLPGYTSENFRWHPDSNLHTSLNMSESELMPLWPMHFNTKDGSVAFRQEQLKNLTNLLDNSLPRVIFNHALMRMAFKLSSFSKNRVEREKECVDFISAKLPDIQEILYARKYFHENTKNNVNKLMQSLECKLKNQIHPNYSKQDADLFRNVISKRLGYYTLGYPNEFFDDGKINAYYKNMEEISENDFLNGIEKYIRYKLHHSTISNNTFDIRQAIGNHSHPTDSVWWYADGLKIPMGYLRAIFTENLPKYALYAKLPVTLGFELVYDTTMMMVRDDSFYFSRRIEFHIVMALYSLYKKYLENHDRDPPLPGLEQYNNEQMFWISVAHYWPGFDFDQSFTRESQDFRRDFKCDAA